MKDHEKRSGLLVEPTAMGKEDGRRVPSPSGKPDQRVGGPWPESGAGGVARPPRVTTCGVRADAKREHGDDYDGNHRGTAQHPTEVAEVFGRIIQEATQSEAL